jgi:cell volume regulation protein A
MTFGIELAISSSTDLILAAIALIILLGYIGEAIFRVTRIPEILILMFIGILIGQFMPLAYTSTLRDLTPLFSSIALIMIMFNSGRIMKFGDGHGVGGRGLLLAFLDITLSCIALTIVMHYMFGWPLLYGALLGIIVGETSTIIVIPLAKKLKTAPSIYNIVLMETTFNTVFAILAFYLLLPINGTSFTAYSYFQYLIDYLSVPVLLGILAGFAWLVARSIIKVANNYLASLAIAMLLYGLVDFLQGSAVVAVLIYAIILGNDKLFGRLIGLRGIISNKKLKFVEQELEFLLRTFFFVLIGMIVILSIDYLMAAVVAVAVLALVRYPEIGIGMHSFSRTNKNLIFSLMQKGLGVAVLSSLVYSMSLPYSDAIFTISFMVIVISNILAAPITRWATRGMTITPSS